MCCWNWGFSGFQKKDFRQRRSIQKFCFRSGLIQILQVEGYVYIWFFNKYLQEILLSKGGEVDGFNGFLGFLEIFEKNFMDIIVKKVCYFYVNDIF